MMKIRRTVPPTAAPIELNDLAHGLLGLFGGKSNRNKLESEIKKQFGASHVFCLSSGKAALALILLALSDLSDRKQVIIPAYTCFSVPSAILRAGLNIVLCDIDPATLDFDYECLERTVTDQTLCVIATHLFGIPSDLDRVESVCRKSGAFVVEDAAQAMGGAYKGKELGTIGDVGFYSLGRGKNITAGSGGIVATRSDGIAAALKNRYASLDETSFFEDLNNLLQVGLMSVLIRPNYFWLPAGLPFLKLGQTFFYKTFPLQKLSTKRAALLRNWRRRLMESNRVRTETAVNLYKNLLSAGVRRTVVPYLRFPLLAADRETRNSIFARSQRMGLGLSLMYPSPINEIYELRDTFAGQFFPGAKRVADTLVALPTHHLLSENDKKAIANLFAGAGSRQALQPIVSASETA